MATYTDNYQLTKPTYAEQADIGVINSNMNIIDDIMHSSQVSLAPAYDQSQTYAEGDVVMYELLMYKCISPTTGVWDASKWERTTASESGGGGSAELDILGEASGAVASFADGASAGLAKCIADIVPKQAGSGTPSPDNVRTISGYTSVKVDVAGKNLCRVNTGNNVVVAHCKSGQTYTFSIRNQGNCGFNLKKNTTEGEQIVRQAPSTDAVMYQTFTADEDFDLFLNGFGSGGASFGSSAYDYQLELGSDATTYEAYAGSTYTTPLGQTVYGGQLNVLTGELTIDRAMVDMETLNWTFNGATYGMYEYGTSITDKANGTTNMICSAFPVQASSAPYCIRGRSVSNFVSVISDESTVEAFKTAVSGYLLVYELATPQTVQLTPQEVNSLLGQNNISADTGDVDIVYVKASAPIQPNPTGTPTATLKKLGIEGTVFEVEGGGGGSSSGINYSTTEQVIGTWIDGKTLYQITKEETINLSSNDDVKMSNVIDVSSSIIHKFDINIRLASGETFGTGVFGNSSTTLTSYACGLYISQGSLRGPCVWGNTSTATCQVTVQYTKITD